MSVGVLAGLALALGASVALNTGFLFQHSGLAQAPALRLTRPREAIASLLGSRAWLGGLVLGLLGWGLHIGALSLAPLSLVQAFVAGGLALAVPVAALGFGHRLLRVERIGVVVMALALGLLPLGLGHVGRHEDFGDATLGIYVGVAALVGAGIALSARGRWQAQALGVAGGAFYGASDTSIKALTSLLHRHGVGGLVSGWVPLAAVVTFAAFACFQRGLQSGRPLPVIALMTAMTNLVSIPAGFVVFGDPIGLAPGWVALHLLAFGIVVVAAGRLAPLHASIADRSSEVVPAPADPDPGRRPAAVGGSRR